MSGLADRIRALWSARQRKDVAPVRDRLGGGAAHSVEDVRLYYDELTPAYLQGFGPVFQGSRPESTEALLAYIADALDLAPGMRLLDAGCGVGGPALWLAERHEVTIDALTLSGVQAEAVRSSAEAQGLADRVHARQGDFHRLEQLYPADSFDRVMFLESLCHAEDYRTVLAGAHRLLKNGGGLYIKDFHALDRSCDPECRQARRADLEKLNSLYRLSLPRLGDLVNLLSELGFLIRFMRMPAYDSTYTHWAAYEQVSGRHWAPTSGEPGEVIQAVEFFCWKI